MVLIQIGQEIIWQMSGISFAFCFVFVLFAFSNILQGFQTLYMQLCTDDLFFIEAETANKSEVVEQPSEDYFCSLAQQQMVLITQSC